MAPSRSWSIFAGLTVSGRASDSPGGCVDFGSGFEDLLVGGIAVFGGMQAMNNGNSMMVHRGSAGGTSALAVLSQQSGAIPALRASIMCGQVWLSYMKEV
jgi:hypothetical protein